MVTIDLQAFSIMLEPAGDAKHAGREIDDCFERGITLQYAERLKLALEKEYPSIRVILSRFPGETLEPLQNANFANRLAVDLYLSIHFYTEHEEEKPKIFLYQFSYNKITDFWEYTTNQLCFIPYDQAHKKHANKIKEYGNEMFKHLKKERYKKYFDVKGFFALPFKPLVGIKSPALAIEIGLKTKKDWPLFIEPIVRSLKPIIMPKS